MGGLARLFRPASRPDLRVVNLIHRWFEYDKLNQALTYARRPHDAMTSNRMRWARAFSIQELSAVRLSAVSRKTICMETLLHSVQGTKIRKYSLQASSPEEAELWVAALGAARTRYHAFVVPLVVHVQRHYRAAKARKRKRIMWSERQRRIFFQKTIHMACAVLFLVAGLVSTYSRHAVGLESPLLERLKRFLGTPLLSMKVVLPGLDFSGRQWLIVERGVRHASSLHCKSSAR